MRLLALAEGAGPLARQRQSVPTQDQMREGDFAEEDPGRLVLRDGQKRAGHSRG